MVERPNRKGLETMTQREALLFVAAVLSTLVEAGSGMPESTGYLALGMNLDDWQLIKRVMIEAGYINVQNHYVTLTAAGRVKGDEINAKVFRVN